AFVGMQDDGTVGLYGNTGAGWGLTMNTATGHVGIGTSPAATEPLIVQASQSSVLLNSTGATNGSVLELQNQTASPAYLGAINFNDASGTPGQIGYLGTYAMTFRTNSAERMRIDSSGRVGIGTTGPAYSLQLASDSAAKPSTNTWTIPSDRRVKKDITPFKDGLGVVSRINPVRYRYTGAAGLPKDAEGIGVVAQEIKEVAPYTVGTFRAKLDEKDAAETDPYAFNSHALTSVMINAIKELDERTKSLVPAASYDLQSKDHTDVAGASPAAGDVTKSGDQAGSARPFEVFQDPEGN